LVWLTERGSVLAVVKARSLEQYERPHEWLWQPRRPHIFIWIFGNFDAGL
jgi:hypothetical protein